MAKREVVREPEEADEDLNSSSPAELFGTQAAPATQEPEPKAEANEDSTTESDEASVPEHDEANPTTEQPAEAQPAESEIVEINGVKRTRDEWNKVLTDAETWRNQAAHFNRKYTEILEQERAREASRTGVPESDPAPQSAQTVDGWLDAIQPTVQALVQQGLLDPEDVEINPKLAAGYAQIYADKMALGRWITERAEPLFRVLETIGVRDREMEDRREVESFHQELNNRISNVAKQGTVFAALESPETRQGFMAYLGKVNPEVKTLMGDQGEEMLSDLFVAFSKKVLLDSAQAASAHSKPATTPQTRRVAGGEGGSPSSRTKEIPNADIVAMFAKDARG